MELDSENVLIAEKNFVELADIDVGSWFAPRYSGEHIPTLSQALDYMKSVNIEAKIDNVVEHFTPEQLCPCKKLRLSAWSMDIEHREEMCAALDMGADVVETT